MAYTNNAFCWHGIISTDVPKAINFYTEVIGYEVQTVPMGDDTATMFAAGGEARMHVMAPPMEGVPSHWDNYLRVEDVDATLAAAVANGGTQMVPATDIPVGRFAVVTSPSGAMLCLFHEADEATARNSPPADGGVHWVELHSHDLDADVAWMTATFGVSTQTMPMPDGSTYYLFMDGKTQVGGAMKAMSDQAPSMWLTWLQVDDADATAQRIKNNGGQVMGPLMDMPGIGRMAVAMDSTGGVFGIIKPAPRG